MSTINNLSTLKINKFLSEGQYKKAIENNLVNEFDLNLTPDLSAGKQTKDGGEIFNDYENNKATGDAAHAEGLDTDANGKAAHVQGRYNLQDNANPVNGYREYAHIVGNGTSDTNRSNAHTLDWDGNAWFAGDVYIGSNSGTNRDEGSKKLVTEEYLNNIIGDIEAALDNIITIQEGLISIEKLNEIIEIQEELINGEQNIQSIVSEEGE